MPNDVDWGCHECRWYLFGKCMLTDREMRYFDLCPEWEESDG